MKIKEFLTKENWTQRAFALRQDGTGCHWLDKEAKKFCLLGATYRCHPGQPATIDALLDRACGNPATWNDMPGRTFEEVKALVEKLDI